MQPNGVLVTLDTLERERNCVNDVLHNSAQDSLSLAVWQHFTCYFLFTYYFVLSLKNKYTIPYHTIPYHSAWIELTSFEHFNGLQRDDNSINAWLFLSDMTGIINWKKWFGSNVNIIVRFYHTGLATHMRKPHYLCANRGIIVVSIIIILHYLILKLLNFWLFCW